MWFHDGKDVGTNPVGHLVEMLGEDGQIWSEIFILRLPPRQYLWNFDSAVELRILDGELLGNIFTVE